MRSSDFVKPHGKLHTLVKTELPFAEHLGESGIGVSSMYIESVNVGRVETILWEGGQIRTGFRKHPVQGRVSIRGVSLAGDFQADRTVHGGPRKALYAYPSEHYAFWQKELEISSLGWGAFGENLTTADWLESSARVGDVVKIGSAKLEVTQPRSPCYKMNAVFARSDMIERFHRSGRSGFYLAVIREGEVGAGDSIALLGRKGEAPSISDLVPRFGAGDSNFPD